MTRNLYLGADLGPGLDGEPHPGRTLADGVGVVVEPGTIVTNCLGAGEGTREGDQEAQARPGRPAGGRALEGPHPDFGSRRARRRKASRLHPDAPGRAEQEGQDWQGVQARRTAGRRQGAARATAGRRSARRPTSSSWATSTTTGPTEPRATSASDAVASDGRTDRSTTTPSVPVSRRNGVGLMRDVNFDSADCDGQTSSRQPGATDHARRWQRSTPAGRFRRTLTFPVVVDRQQGPLQSMASTVT